MTSHHARPLVSARLVNPNGIVDLSLRDIFTFEFVFMLFLYAGSVKRIPPLTEIDMTLVAAGLGMLWGGFVLLRRGTSASRRAIQYAVLHSILVIWALTLYCFSGSGPYAEAKIQKVAFLSSWAVIAPLFLVNTSEKIHRLLRLVVAISLVATFIGLMHAPSGGQITMWGQDNYQPLGRTCGLALLIILGWGAFNGSLKFWLIHCPLCASLFVVLMLSGARQAALGLVIGGASLAVGIAFRFGWTRLVKGFICGFTCIALFLGGLQLSLFPRLEKRLYDNRIANMLTVGEREGWHPGEENRPKLWNASLQLWENNPVAGAGIGGFHEFVKIQPWGDRWPHNLFLEWLSELGVVGFLLGLVMLCIPISTWLQGCKTSADGLIVILGSVVIFLLVCAMFSWDWPDNRDLFSFGSLLLAAAADEEKKSRLPYALPIPATVFHA
jgi:O-antigen ligase